MFPGPHMTGGADGDVGMSPPGSLRRIRLELANSAEFPGGSHRHGFEFVAPLDGCRHIDLQKWEQFQRFCSVRRFWPGEADHVGHLVHRTGGDEHRFWVFDYDAGAGDGLENSFGAHAFVPGEYVTIRDRDAAENSFRVVSVSSLR